MSTIAVVGCGYWGRNLVRNFAEIGVLGGIIDPSADTAKSLADQYNVNAMSFSEALANDAITGIAIAAPAELHAELSIAASNAGKHVYVEKPIALNMVDGEAMKKAAELANRTLMVGHLLRYHPAFETLLWMVQSGKLGRVIHAYSHRLSLGKFRTNEDALWSFAPHDVSMLLALFGREPLKVSASGGGYITDKINDISRLEMDFGDGSTAHIFASWLHPFKEHRLVVIGTEAMAVFEDSAPAANKLRLYSHSVKMTAAGPEPIKAEPVSIDYPSHEPLRAECEHFIECVRGTISTPRTDADEGLRVLRVLSSGK